MVPWTTRTLYESQAAVSTGQIYGVLCPTLPKFLGMDPEPTSIDNVAARLKLTREALGLTQVQICRMTGISTQTWNNAETGDNMLGLQSGLLLCRATGVTLEWIYRGRRANLPQAIAEEIARREPPRRRRA